MEPTPSAYRAVDVLVAITTAMNSGFSQQEILDRLLERTVIELGYKAATLRLLDAERQTLELKAAYGLSEQYLTKGAVEVSRSGIDQKVLTGQRAESVDIGTDSGFQYPEAARHEGLASALAVPLVLHDQAIGVARVYTATPHQFDQDEQRLLATIANLGAQAIARAQLYGAFEAIARQLTSSLDLKDVLTTLLLRSVQELHVKAGSIRLLGPRKMTLHLAAAYGLSASYLNKGAVEVAHSPIDQRVLKSGQPAALTEVMEQSGLQYPEEARREGIRAILVVPLRVGGTPIGVLRLYSGQTRRFSAEERAFAGTIADLGALAIENAKLHAQLQARLEAVTADANGWYRYLALS